AAGLVALTYGLIEAGQDGWNNVGALLSMVAGLALLVGFFMWERRLTRRPGGRPLLELTLFDSASFTMPQYFQGVLGSNAMGSGLRLLPLIAGLIVGAVPAARVVHLVGAKVA